MIEWDICLPERRKILLPIIFQIPSRNWKSKNSTEYFRKKWQKFSSIEITEKKNIREWKSWQLQGSVHARTWRGRMEKFRYTLGDSMQNWKLTVETARARRKVFAESFLKNRIGSTARVQNVGYGNFIGSVRHLNRMSRISKGAGRWNKE